MPKFTPKKWEEFLNTKHSDFYKEFYRLKDELDQVLNEFMEEKESREEAELSDLCASIERYVKLYIDFDPFGRSESYNLPRVPFSKAVRKFLGYARKQAPVYTTGLLGRYWRENNPAPAKRKRTKKRKKTKVIPSPPKPVQMIPNPNLCPRCKERELFQKDVQTYRDPITDSWVVHRMWRCPKCYWRQKKECENSEWSHTPPKSSIKRPDDDLGDSLRSHIAHRFTQKKILGPKIVQNLGKELSLLFYQEKEIDMALVNYRRRRLLHEIEIRLLMQLFERYPQYYDGELKEHWDKTVREQYKASWPDSTLREFLRENSQFDASTKISKGRCSECLIGLKKITSEYRNMDVSTPNPLDIRPTRVDHYECPKCKKREIILVEL